MTNPHIANTEWFLGKVTEERMQGVFWQEVVLTLLQAEVEATLAVAVELKGLREAREGGGS